MQQRLYTPRLSAGNIRGLYQTARKFGFTMAKLLNLIVATALEEFKEERNSC